MYLDLTYVYIVIPALFLALLAQLNVSSTFKKYQKVLSGNRMTAADAARRILSSNGLGNVAVERVSGNLTDHYDPRTNVIRLSESVYDSQSVAAIGVAAHEAGHAVQYAENYAPIKLRAAIIPITQIGANIAPYLVLLGLIFSFYPLCYAGLILFTAVVAFQLITLPVEFNASRRAMDTLRGGILSDSEADGAAKVLRAAAMTYVAALAVALANLIRFAVLASRSRDRKR